MAVEIPGLGFIQEGVQPYREPEYHEMTVKSLQAAARRFPFRNPQPKHRAEVDKINAELIRRGEAPMDPWGQRGQT